MRKHLMTIQIIMTLLFDAPILVNSGGKGKPLALEGRFRTRGDDDGPALLALELLHAADLGGVVTALLHCQQLA